MRSWRTQHNLVALSANNAETAINTEQSADTTFLVANGDMIMRDPKRETNENELTGKEEADAIYNLGDLSNFSFNFEKAQPQHLAMAYGFGLGSVASAAAGSGYAHTITPIANDLDASRSNPSMTGVMRVGNQIVKGRFASLFVDSITAKFPRGKFVSLSGAMLGTGKFTSSVTEEVVAVVPDADPFSISTSLTLASAVQGATAAERLQNVQRIRVELATGVWTEVEFTAVSAATPAVVTIEALNGISTDSVNFKVLYIPTEPAWCTFPSQISETPLRVTDATFYMGGKYTAAGGFEGGRQFGCEVESVEHSFQNNMQIEMCMGGSGAYADRGFRDGRVQTLKVDREFRDYILQQSLEDGEMLSAQIVAEGLEFDTGHNYTIALYFPQIALLKAPWSANGKRLAEAGDFRVFEHATEGSVRVLVKNLVATYAA